MAALGGRGRGFRGTSRPMSGGGGGGYPAIALTPQVASIVSKTPEAAPGLVDAAAAVATSSGYPSLLQKGASSTQLSFTGASRGRGVTRLGNGTSLSPGRLGQATAPTQDSPRIITRPPTGPMRPPRPRSPPKSSTASVSTMRAVPEEQPELTQATVLSAVGIEDAGSSSLQDISQLIFRHKGLSSLTTFRTVAFGELISLRILSLSHNSLSDIGPLAELPCLEELNISYNQISDLSPAHQCETLEVLLATSNKISSVKGIEVMPKLNRLSLFSNLLEDLDDLLETLKVMPSLSFLDLGGNSCFVDPSQRHGLVRALPSLREIDGEVLGAVDRQLAAEFFLCAEEVGLQERPGTACGLRPKTAPVQRENSNSSLAKAYASSAAPSGDCPSPSDGSVRARSPFRRSGSRGSSRAPSASPDGRDEVPQPPIEDPSDSVASLERFTSYVQTLQLRLQTTQVECENLRRQIHDLRLEADEPVLGTAELRKEMERLEKENEDMHARVHQNRQMRIQIEQKEAEILQQRACLGLQPEDWQRPGTRSGRPGTAARPRTAQSAVEAVEGILGLFALSSQVPDTADSLRARCKALRKELEGERERTSQLRATACSAILGRDISPAKDGRESKEVLNAPEKSLHDSCVMLRGVVWSAEAEPP
eukprot:TRINITY_DN6611_c0_g1_i1.p1 TRINITY_DN6611_c0_g1~~TRINITY_DN6611_c0_g1_i1.p1  ORF type:complete len:679 (+),score=125.75 TRINITY_DN6611_c0_g1_i1:83-2038(+)